jgi:hypothetical protein
MHAQVAEGEAAQRRLRQQLAARDAQLHAQQKEHEDAAAAAVQEAARWEALGAQQQAALEASKAERDDAVASSRALRGEVRRSGHSLLRHALACAAITQWCRAAPPAHSRWTRGSGVCAC